MEVNPIKLNVKTKEDFDLNVDGTNVNQKGALTIVPDDGIYLGTGEKSESILKIPEFHETNPNLLMNSDFSNFYRCGIYYKDELFETDKKYFLCDRWFIIFFGYSFDSNISNIKYITSKKIEHSLEIATKNNVSTNTEGGLYQVLSNIFESNEPITFSGFIRTVSGSPEEKISIGILIIKNDKIVKNISIAKFIFTRKKICPLMQTRFECF